MVSTFIGLLDIQSWWEIPCIAHFCSLFSSAFSLPDIDIEDLESAVLNDGTDDTVGLLPELIVCLLKGCDDLNNRNEITTSNYQMFLRRFLRQQSRLYNTKNYFDTDIDFQSLPLRNKLLILHSLCHFRLESKNVQTILGNLEADSLRVEPLGYDSKNSGYWYFYGTRLYREDTKPGGKSKVWQVICFTEEDWQNLAAKFKKSTSPEERALHKILADNFIPKLPQLFRERERLRRRKLLQVRNSVRIRNLVEEKQRVVIEKQVAEEIQRQQLDEELILHAANKFRTRLRRRSQSSSTASGISTYASSIRASANSSEFLTQHETFCLSPGLGDGVAGAITPKNSLDDPIDRNDSQKDIETGNVRQQSAERVRSSVETNKRQQSKRSSENVSDECSGNESDHLVPSTEKKNNYRKTYNTSAVKSESDHSSSDSETTLAVDKTEMAPTTNIKLPGRQTNNSLSSLTGNIFIPPVISNCASTSEKSKTDKTTTEALKSKEKSCSSSSTTNSENSGTQRKKKSKSSDIFTETDEVLQIGMHKVLLYVKNHRDAWPFVDPVDEEIAPRYYSIIRRPMDLLKMEEKLDSEAYTKYSDFRNDFKLIVNNCRLYNGQNNEYTEMVNNLQEAFDKATKKYFDQNSSDEEVNLEYPDSKTNVFREKSYNKNTTSKAPQKELPKEVLKKGKERQQNGSSDEVEEPEKELSEQKVENNVSRVNKRKRKDKDKRRKKKTKTKTQQATVLTDQESNDDEEKKSVNDNSDSDAPIDDCRSKTRTNDKSKSKDNGKLPGPPSAKRSKTKLTVKEKQTLEKERHTSSTSKGKQPTKKTEEEKQKKSSKSGRAGKNGTDSIESLKNYIESENLEKESRSRSSTKRKHSPSHENVGTSRKKPAIEKRNSSASNKSKPEKDNQNTKSKATKAESASTSKEASKQIPRTISKNQSKDNNKNTNLNKKRRSRGKKAELVEVEPEPVKEERVESDRDESISRSPSPLYKVDLHKKYAKSASVKDENSSLEESKCESESPANIKKKTIIEDQHDDELMSISSRSLSRSASPFNSFESDIAESEKTNATSGNKKTKAIDSEPAIVSPPDSESSKLPLFLDKYDLIKQRRNRNTEEKWNQIVKEAEKIKDIKKVAQSSKQSTSASAKEKNQKLKETIEKLKVKNAKSKERSVLIDEIFGVKPTQEPRDERTIFEKLSETCADSKIPIVMKKQTLPPASSPGVVKPIQDEYDFVDDLVASTAIPSKKIDTAPVEKPATTTATASNKKQPSKKNLPATVVTKKPAPTTPSKTNMEALELETEQTLKDINRWLEHTPRFPEFSSASNSPSRYNLLDDFDAVASKIDPADFRRPVSISTPKIESVTMDDIADNKQDVIADLIPPIVALTPSITTTAVSSVSSTSVSATTSTSIATTARPKESTSTTQFLANPPPPPHVKNQQQKETKRKTLKEKLTGNNRRKDLLRTIDRLQPGKSKGNLISNIHNNKPDELFPLGATNKIKEVKNSLVVKTDETGPKLSLGSVLQTEGFGLGQLHNFTDGAASNDKKIGDSSPTISEMGERKEEISTEESIIEGFEELEKAKEPEIDTKMEQKSEKQMATPNLSAWFKAFGAPKKAKKAEEEEKKAEAVEMPSGGIDRVNSEQMNTANSFSTLKSPPTLSETFSLPAPRQRKASTGSTVSERSSFSQDPDSPRVGIDDRFGAYAGPYASPIGASPIMVSPKPDEIGKPTSPYPLNGAIKVGFYQDTTTKSSPEKSCSPRELPSPYPQYSQHIYSSASSPTVNTEVTNTNTYGGCYNPTPEQPKAAVYPTAASVSLFEQYKQPRSQESDYNSSMSPSTNPNSPYQQPQNSPYQHQNSPYQQTQNSPYQQSQNSPFQNQSNGTSNILVTSSPNSPNMSQQQSQQGESPGTQNSPYHQQTNSPYQQPISSPYHHQNPTSPYQTPSQQPQQANLGFVPQQSGSQPTKSAQPQQPTESAFPREAPSYSMHESNTQYQAQNRNPMASYEQEIPKRSPGTSLLGKMQTQTDWNTQMDLSVPQTHQSQASAVPIPDLNPMSHVTNQLNTPPLQNDQLNAVNQLQAESNKPTMQYQSYPQFENPQKDTSKSQNMYGNDMTMDMTMGMQRQLNQQELNKNAQQQQQQQQQQSNLNKRVQSNEADIMNLGSYTEPQSNKMLKRDQVQLPEKQFDSAQKHQQMFDTFLGSMAGNKNLGFSKPLDISSSKAFEMFNRAATMGFPKDFPNTLMGQQKNDVAPVPNQQPQLSQQSYHLNPGKSMDTSANNVAPISNKPLNMVNNNFQQQIPQHMNQNNSGKVSTFSNAMPNTSDAAKLQQHPQSVFAQTAKHSQQLQANSYAAPDKIQNDLIVPNPRQDQMGQMARDQQLNMDLSNYKTYNNPASMLDPLRNLNHPLSMMDDGLLGLPSSTPTGYYDKNIPPAHMFSKSLGQQMYQNPSPYGAPPRDQQNAAGSFVSPVPNNVNSVVQPLEMVETKQSKRKKKKTATPTPMELGANQNAMLQQQQQQQAHQNSQQQSSQQQGFQLYAGLKTAASGTAATTDTSPISLKTATSMVPGSAFNFGPSAPGLGLPSGIYGDNSGYLDEFRGAPTPYYLPPTHRTPTDGTNEKTNNAGTAAAAAAASSYQFLAHTPARPTYPFMNSQLDPNSPIYQQYIQRQEELRARMMINQGLLGPGAPGGYPQPGYRPTLGMPKHYDMSRQTWF